MFTAKKIGVLGGMMFCAIIVLALLINFVVKKPDSVTSNGKTKLLSQRDKRAWAAFLFFGRCRKNALDPVHTKLFCLSFSEHSNHIHGERFQRPNNGTDRHHESHHCPTDFGADGNEFAVREHESNHQWFNDAKSHDESTNEVR